MGPAEHDDGGSLQAIFVSLAARFVSTQRALSSSLDRNNLDCSDVSASSDGQGQRTGQGP